MPLASDGKGNFMSLGSDGQWAPAQRARNPETGAELVLDGAEWKPLPGTEPSALGSAARGVVRGATMGAADELRAKTDELFGGDHDRSLAQSRAQNRADDQTNPLASAAGQIVGGVGGMVATRGLSAVTGLTRFGARVAAPLISRLNPLMATGAGYAASGAAGGGVAGFNEGEGGPVNRLMAGAIGGGIGAGVGLGAGALAGAAGRIISPVRPNLSPEAQGLVTAARDEGIPLSVGQETGSRVMKNLEGTLAQAPGSAGMAANDLEVQRRAFNTAAWRRAGETYDIAGPDQLNASRARSGGEIGRIAGSHNLDASDPAFLDRLVVSADRARGFASSDVERQTLARINDIVGKVQAGDVIPGQAYREMRSEIGETMRSTQDGDLRRHLRGILDTLDDGFAASIPASEKEAFDTARRHYANLHVIADAAGGAGEAAAQGHIPPLALQRAVNRSTGGGYAWGEGDLNQLAHVGQSVLRQPPDSGTAGRSLMNSLVTGSLPAGGAMAGFAVGGVPGAMAGAAAPFVIPSVAQSILNSRRGRAWLTQDRSAALTGPAQVLGASTAGTIERNRLLQD